MKNKPIETPLTHPAIDQPFYSATGVHAGFIDIFSDINKDILIDPEDSTKLIIYLVPPKQN